MISYETIDGRPATVAYVTDDMQPASPEDATMIKIIFDDGEIRFGVKSAKDQLKSKFRNEKMQALWALRAVFNEADHPRDDRGRWTDAGGGDDEGGGRESSGFAFFSPNVRDDLDLNGAVQALHSGQHKALRDASHHINKELGQDAHEYDIVGAWKDGAENSVMDIVNKSNWETLKASAAMKGHLADQKSVLVYQDGAGDTPLYSFEAKGDIKDIHERLLQEGLAFHTLVPKAGGAQVFVADPDLNLDKVVERAADGAEITTDFGRAEFIGTDSREGDDRTDREQRDDARRAYEEIISQSPVQNSQAVWAGTHNRWGKTAEQGDLESKPPPPPPGELANPIDTKASVDEKVAQLHALTKINKPTVEKFAASIGEVGVDALGKNHPVVSEVSVKHSATIKDKATRPVVLRKKPWFGVEHIRDSLRFRTTVDSFTQVPDIVKALEDSGEFEIVKYEPEKLTDPKEWGVRLLPIDMKMKNGQIIEYYIIASEQRIVHDDGHALYDKWRDVNEKTLSNRASRERERDMAKSSKIYSDAWAAYLKRTGQTEEDVKNAVRRR